MLLGASLPLCRRDKTIERIWKKTGASHPASHGSSTFGTAAWKTKSVMSSSVLLEACIVITVTLGLVFDLSKVNSIFSPFLLYAVMEGMPAAEGQEQQRSKDLESILNVSRPTCRP